MHDSGLSEDDISVKFINPAIVAADLPMCVRDKLIHDEVIY